MGRPHPCRRPSGHLGVPDTERRPPCSPASTPTATTGPRSPRLTVPGSETPPADLAGLLRHLDAVNALSGAEHPENNGTVEVQTITGPDGSVRHVVYLPGTDDLTTTPWSQDGDVRDLGTNLLLVSGQDNAYQQGILDAMPQAGIRPGEPVALVGHSQGGMEAAAILAHGSPYDVTQRRHRRLADRAPRRLPARQPRAVAGEPRRRVPLLDGADNPDSAEQVTVRFDDHETSVAGNHGLDHYVAGADAVQASDDPSIRDQLASLRGGRFHRWRSGQEVTSQVFQITRVP